jgi:uncharacterized membrane protein
MARGRRRSRRHLNAVVTTLVTLMAATGVLTTPADAADTPGEGPDRLLPLRLGLLLPGTFSNPEAIDGDLVVGDAVAGYGPRAWDSEFDRWFRPMLDHAVVWDITDPDPAPLDLGTLGGRRSHAVAVDETWVVGSAETGAGPEHAFAVDVSAEHPTMLDLGTLPGYTLSWATAVDDGIVVGTSSSGGLGQAFAVDLNAENPQMVSLGSLGGHSNAAAVDNGVVVGRAWSSEDDRMHVFAVDLRSPDPTMRDLGTFGGYAGPSRLVIDDGVVVGSVGTLEADGRAGPNHAFVVNLSDPEATLLDLHSGAPDSESWAVDVENGVVVGHERPRTGDSFAFVYDVATGSRRQLPMGVIDVDSAGIALGVGPGTDGVPRALVFDATNPEPEFADRGALVSLDRTGPNPADEQVLVGTIMGRAAVWPVGETIRIHRPVVSAHESTGAVAVRVLRTGDLSDPASVRYRTEAGTARVDTDFTSTAGTLSFEPGQSEATIRVPVRDDTHPEPIERFTVRLSEPSAGQRLLTSQTTVSLRESDQRPDLKVSTAARRGYIGDDVYNDTAARQTKTAPARRGGTRSFYVRLHNDHDAAITTSIRPRQTPSGVRVRYIHAGEDVTKAVTGRGGWKVSVRPDRRVLVRLDVTAGRRLRLGATPTVKLAATWSGDQTRRDVVGAKIQVRR